MTRPATPSTPPRAAPVEPGRDPRQGWPAVLVIDDEPHVLSLLRDILGLRYRVFCASSTAGADAILGTEPIRAIVCDYAMPAENGLAFFTRIRQTHPRVSRILLTGHTHPELLLKAINSIGVLRYIVKPFDPDALLEAVDEAMREHDSAERHSRLARENADLSSSLHHVLSRVGSIRESPGRLLAASTVGLAAVLAAALMLGLLVFVVLYALKSALGIDFLPDWSHSGGP